MIQSKYRPTVHPLQSKNYNETPTLRLSGTVVTASAVFRPSCLRAAATRSARVALKLVSTSIAWCGLPSVRSAISRETACFYRGSSR